VTTSAERLWQRLGCIAYGADYNPEQWPRERWDEDIRLMRQAGVNLVSVNIFGWAGIQVTADEWDFGWLDDILGRLAAAGVCACLATGTASPPPWFSRRHPETLPVTADGIRLSPGGRQHYCPSSPVYRSAAAEVARRTAERYAGHPALAAWHVNNEYGGHVPQCFCDTSAADFRRWLHQRYADLDTLNDAWSTTFWSQRYTDWEEVLPPRLAPTFANPSQQLDFARFSSDALIACYRAEAEVLRRITPEVPLTTNNYTKWTLDSFAWGPELDIVAFDSYTDPRSPRTTMEAAIAFDIQRCARNGEPWLLLEQAPSAVNWRDVNLPKSPGRYELGSMQAVAHGANGAMSFQFRQSAGGAEKFHSAFVPHAGADTRQFRDVTRLGRALGRLGSGVLATRHTAEVALCFTWPSWWALELPARPSSLVRARTELARWYEPFWHSAVPVDVIPPARDLSRYKLIVVPSTYLLSEAESAALCDYATGGGVLLVAFFSGIVDAHDRVPQGPYPASFTDLTGVRTEEFCPLAEGTTAQVHFSDGVTVTATLWSEFTSAEPDVQILARFADGSTDGRPAVTRREVGRGQAWYVATALDEAGTAMIARQARDAAGVLPLVREQTRGIEAARRHSGDHDLLFLLNHAAAPGHATLPRPGRDLLTGRRVSGRTPLEPYSALVIDLEHHQPE